MANSTTHLLPYPIRKARFSLGLTFRTAAGVLTDPTTPDTEVSSDGGATFADCTEEITTGGSSGFGYLTLTGAEMDNPLVMVSAKSANDAATPSILHPRNLALVGSGTLSAGSAGGGTLGTLLAYDVTNCFLRTTGGTGGGGTGGANNQARRILTYTTSTGTFTVTNWETTPDATTTYDVLLPEGVTLGMLRTLNPTTAGRTLVVDAAGLADANAVKLGPTGTGTTQTARDLGLSVLLAANQHVIVDSGTITTYTGNTLQTADVAARTPAALTANGNMKSSLVEILTTALTETSGQIAAAFKKFFNIAAPAATMDHGILVDTVTTASNLTNLPSIPANWLTAAGINAGALNGKGDWLLATGVPTNFSALLITAGGIVTDTAGTTTLLTRLTGARAGYLDNLNVGGAVASHADIVAVNQSASKHLLLVTVGQYSPGESYTIECRTFSATDGSAVNADSTPTLTATGAISGSLAANLGAVSNPATGVYRATYTNPGSPTLEQIRFDASTTIAGSTFTLSAYAQTVDEPTVVWTATDQSHLTAMFNKLPTNNIADETLLLAAIGTPMQAGSPMTLSGDLTPTMKTSVTTAATAATPIAASVTGAVGSVTGNVGGSVASVVGLTAANLDVAVSSRMVTFSLPSNFFQLGISAGGHIINVDNVTNLTNAPTAGDFTATMKASLNAATPASVVGAVGSVTAAVTLAANQHVIVDSGTVTNLTNLPAITANWLTAAGINAAALNGKGDWSTYAGGDTAGITTLLARIGGTLTISGGGVVLAAAGLDTVLIESGIAASAGLVNDAAAQLTAINARQALALIQSACAAVLAGAATTTVTIEPAGLPSAAARITATVDSSGNRSAVVLKVPT